MQRRHSSPSSAERNHHAPWLVAGDLGCPESRCGALMHVCDHAGLQWRALRGDNKDDKVSALTSFFDIQGYNTKHGNMTVMDLSLKTHLRQHPRTVTLKPAVRLTARAANQQPNKRRRITSVQEERVPYHEHKEAKLVTQAMDFLARHRGEQKMLWTHEIQCWPEPHPVPLTSHTCRTPKVNI